MPDPAALRSEVYSCDACARLQLGFERPGTQRPFFKFPPIIGSQGHAPLLFMGLNPRRSATNAALHDTIMADPAAFDALAANRVDGRPYIAIRGSERHYRPHAVIASSVFPGRPFEEVAAVTELFLCASEDAGVLGRAGTPCADRFLGRVMRVVEPRVVVAVGRVVEAHLRPRFGPQEGPFRAIVHGVKVLVVPMPHPNARGEKQARYDDAAAHIARELGVEPTGIAPAARLGADWSGDPGPGEPRPTADAPTGRSPASEFREWPYTLAMIATVVLGASAMCCCGGWT